MASSDRKNEKSLASLRDERRAASSKESRDNVRDSGSKVA